MVVFQCFAQGQQTATNPGFDGSERFVDGGGNFVMCPPAKKGQLQRVSLGFRQFI
jgi:hypothetical protein